MKVHIFSIYDSKTEAYLQPFFSTNSETAVRSMRQAIQNPESNFCLYPEDYTLFEIGTFNDSTAEIKNHDAKISLGTATVLKGMK